MTKNNVQKAVLIIFVALFLYLVGAFKNSPAFEFVRFLVLQGKYGKIISESKKIDDDYLEYQGGIYRYADGEFYELSQAITSDTVNFQPLSELYAKDSSNYFFYSRKINGVDYDSVKIISDTDTYLIDKYHVYYGDKVLPNSDSSDFVFVDKKKNLVKSGSNVYVQEKIVPDIDGNKFVYLEGTSFFKDDDTLVQFNSYIDTRGNKSIDHSYFKEISGINVGKFNKIDSDRCGDGIVILDCLYGKKLN